MRLFPTATPAPYLRIAGFFFLICCCISFSFPNLAFPQKNSLPELPPDLGSIPKNRVFFGMYEPMPALDRWLQAEDPVPTETMRWTSDYLFLSRIPLHYDSWGIRDDWHGPSLLRIACDVEIPPGEYKVWLRARAMGRLWLDGQVIARTDKVRRKSQDGEQPVSPVPQPPFPGLRPHGYHQQEVSEPLVIEKGGAQRLILELIVGGPKHRIETGEILVALQPASEETLYLLGPGSSPWIELRNEHLEPRITKWSQEMNDFDIANRRAASQSQNEYWDARHQHAQQWSRNSLRPELPAEISTPELTSRSEHPVDRFIHAKIEQAWGASRTTDREVSERFYGKVLPILRDNCFRCHGEKSNGDLRVDSREAILQSGESESPAVVPGSPDDSELIAQIRAGAMPPTESGLSKEQIETLEKWVEEGAPWPDPIRERADLEPTPSIDDAAFLRRVYFDTIGLPPSREEAVAFLSDTSPTKREALIDRLLQDDRVADHWMSFWQDLLAENPPLINQSMGSTGPFRWFLYDALLDRKPLDRMVTELILMRGSVQTGGSAAFKLAGESDSPMAAKGGILASAFLGIDLQCARCHDSPYHSTLQQDLYALAAMLDRQAVAVPKTSRVPDEFFEKKGGRESLIKVSLAPDAKIEPIWPFVESLDLSSEGIPSKWLREENDTREQLALLITSPQNQRFSQVFANRVWKRLMGTGIVEPVDDWEGQVPSHPELLNWLAAELIESGYDWTHIMRVIFTSETYQRASAGSSVATSASDRFFHAPDRRRLSAEQIVDALHVALGRDYDCEELTFVHDGARTLGQRQTFGVPHRAWMFVSLNNERDRPSLALPRAAVIVDVMDAFGWPGSRQKPMGQRDDSPNVLQPALLANGTLVRNLTRASYDSEMAKMAIEATSPRELVTSWFLRILSRPPTEAELEEFSSVLAEGFETRIVAEALPVVPPSLPELPLVTWFNHLQPETTTIQLEHEKRVDAGPPADPRLSPSWREVYEDFVWSLVNSPTFVWTP